MVAAVGAAAMVAAAATVPTAAMKMTLDTTIGRPTLPPGDGKVALLRKDEAALQCPAAFGAAAPPSTCGHGFDPWQ